MLFQGVLEKIAREFDRLKIPYMVIGGQAVLVYGEPRFTKDIDITLGVGAQDAEKILNILTQIGFQPSKEDPIEFAKRTFVLPSVDTETGIPVDFAFSFSEYEAQAIARAKPIQFGSVLVRIVALEDLIIHKVVAGRPRDLEDVNVLLEKNPTCNLKYILNWLKQFDEGLEMNTVHLFNEVLKTTK